MSKTHKERILDYLWSIVPDSATNRQIRERTGIKSHQQVHPLTQELMHYRLIQSDDGGWSSWSVLIESAGGRSPVGREK